MGDVFLSSKAYEHLFTYSIKNYLLLQVEKKFLKKNGNH